MATAVKPKPKPFLKTTELRIFRRMWDGLTPRQIAHQECATVGEIYRVVERAKRRTKLASLPHIFREMLKRKLTKV